MDSVAAGERSVRSGLRSHAPDGAGGSAAALGERAPYRDRWILSSTISWRYELIDGRRCLRGIEQARGRGAITTEFIGRKPALFPDDYDTIVSYGVTESAGPYNVPVATTA